MKRILLSLFLSVLLTLTLLFTFGCDENSATTQSSVATETATETEAPKPIKDPLASYTKRNFAHSSPSSRRYQYRLGVVIDIEDRLLTVYGRDAEKIWEHNPYLSFYATNDYPGVQIGDRFWFVEADNGEWRISPNSNKVDQIAK